MPMPQGRALAAALLLVLAGCATPIQEQRWLHATTANFDVISSAGRSRTVEIVERLEMFRAAVLSLTHQERLDSPVPARVYLFGDHGTYARFSFRRGLAGFFIAAPDRNFLVIDASDERAAINTAYHEFVHFMLSNARRFSYPAWYNEGLAEVLSTMDFGDGRMIVGKPPINRALTLRFGSLLSLRRVMEADDILRWSRRALGMFYAQAWALTHYLHFGHFLGGPDRHAAMLDYLDRVNRGTPPGQACREAFGQSVEELEKGFVRFVGEGKIPNFELLADDFPPPDDVAIGVLPRDEQLLSLGHLAASLGPESDALALDLLRRGVELHPRHAELAARLGRLLARREDPGARALLRRAVQLGPDDPVVLRLHADALLSGSAAAPGTGSAERLREARDQYRRSLALDPSAGAAHLGLGRVLQALGEDRGEAIAALERARSQLPGVAEASIELAELYLDDSRDAEAQRLLREVSSQPHSETLPDAWHEEFERLAISAGLDDVPRSTRHLESRLDVEQPRPDALVRGLVGLVEVRGRGGLWEASKHDVLIAIDESNSTLLPTGEDLDGDGEVGEHRRSTARTVWAGSTDVDDSIIRAELSAARTLIEQLDADTTRVALLAFAGRARVLAELGPPADALAALDAYVVHFDGSGTSIGNAFRGAVEEFVARRDLENRRQRSIVLLSDGQPTYPNVSSGILDALQVATLLGDLGVRVHSFAIGDVVREHSPFFEQIALRTGGRFVPVEHPADVIALIESLHFTGLEALEVLNLDTGQRGRATRVFPDGSFDGYLPLTPGLNRIRVRATIEQRGTLTRELTVRYERPEKPGEADLAAARSLRIDLEARTVETDLLMERQRAARRREARPDLDRDLEIEIDDRP